ncbi:hypothetical protein C8T65DRAFT_129949 [Cerioporus squamosus]|nr:hypothetical protein C8T65DRAFT_129949 [Cerioporus squamosus]
MECLIAQTQRDIEKWVLSRKQSDFLDPTRKTSKCVLRVPEYVEFHPADSGRDCDDMNWEDPLTFPRRRSRNGYIEWWGIYLVRTSRYIDHIPVCVFFQQHDHRGARDFDENKLARRLRMIDHIYQGDDCPPEIQFVGALVERKVRACPTIDVCHQCFSFSLLHRSWNSTRWILGTSRSAITRCTSPPRGFDVFDIEETRKAIRDALDSPASLPWASKQYIRPGPATRMKAVLGQGGQQLRGRARIMKKGQAMSHELVGEGGGVILEEGRNEDRSDNPGNTACANCGSPHNLRQCKRCRRRFYCGAVCQKEHWESGHKASCGK